MPTYDYECASCGHRFEVFEKAHESGVKPCPRCGRRKSHRQLGIGAGVIFRGSGFHVTDYRKKSAHPTPPPSESAPAEPATKKTARHEKKKE